MKTLVLNETLLNVLCTVKAKQNLAINETTLFEEKSDWL